MSSVISSPPQRLEPWPCLEPNTLPIYTLPCLTHNPPASQPLPPPANMSDLANRKVFKVFNQEFVVDERYNVTKELGQGAYGIVWYVRRAPAAAAGDAAAAILTPCPRLLTTPPTQRCHQQPDRRGRRHQKGHQRLQQEDPRQARSARNQAAPALQRSVSATHPNSPRDPANALQATATYHRPAPSPEEQHAEYFARR